MKLYDLRDYAHKRAEHAAVKAVVEAACHINQPGAVIELKQRVSTWLSLHQSIIKLRA